MIINNLKITRDAPSYIWKPKNSRAVHRKQVYYICPVCNKESMASLTKIKSGKIKNCGSCGKKRHPKHINKMPTIEKYFKYAILLGAKKRNLDVTINLDQFELLVKQNCIYCNKAPREITYLASIKLNETLFANGVDRINNDLGYTIENCAACCKDCNKVKNNHSKAEFLNIIERIYKHSIMDKQ